MDYLCTLTYYQTIENCQGDKSKYVENAKNRLIGDFFKSLGLSIKKADCGPDGI